ncbi:MAG: hypothetical protein WC838_01065 [Candidatus Margulisiibacteriota bacterium]|jgi:hypothetical protein
MIRIEYIFKLSESHHHSFTVNLDELSLRIVHPEDRVVPDWALLNKNRCEHCPMDASLYKYCPVAANIAHLIDTFKDVPSYQTADITVVTAERNFSKTTSVQEGMSAILGILMVASGCSVMEKLKPMVRFHLPFSNLQETLFRATSTYMLGQYFMGLRGRKPDFDLDGLDKIYQRVHKLNRFIAERMRGAYEEDSGSNALGVLDLFSNMLNIEVKKHLQDLEYIYAPYIIEEGHF